MFKALHSAKDWRPLDTWKLYQYDLNKALAEHAITWGTHIIPLIRGACYDKGLILCYNGKSYSICLFCSVVPPL